jgi:hypothetical protein
MVPNASAKSEERGSPRVELNPVDRFTAYQGNPRTHTQDPQVARLRDVSLWMRLRNAVFRARVRGLSRIGRGALLSGREVRQPRRRHWSQTKELGRFDPAMAGRDPSVIVDQNRIIEAEFTDTRAICSTCFFERAS